MKLGLSSTLFTFFRKWLLELDSQGGLVCKDGVRATVGTRTGFSEQGRVYKAQRCWYHAYSQILALRVKDLSDERIVALRFDDEVDMRGSHWGSVEAAKDIACWAIEGDLENR